MEEVLPLSKTHCPHRLSGLILRSAVGIYERTAVHGDRGGNVHPVCERNVRVVIEGKPRIIDRNRGSALEHPVVEKHIGSPGKYRRAAVSVDVREIVSLAASLEKRHRLRTGFLLDDTAKIDAPIVRTEDKCRRGANARVGKCAGIPLQCRAVPARAQCELERAVQIQRGTGSYDQKLIGRQRVVSTTEFQQAPVDFKVPRERLSAEVCIPGAIVRGVQNQSAGQRLDETAPAREQAAHRELTAGAHGGESLRAK